MDKKDLPIISSERGDDLHNLEIADSSDLIRSASAQKVYQKYGFLPH